ncbi:hypothetical protein ACFQFQ_14885 [Sulfitobacter porphyrae]|uniref:Uncharacterized protein n=1 Tax=Sulfitobacter porphyrae TaxID=1246864 RepID=A0ABW2B441_9RHOB
MANRTVAQDLAKGWFEPKPPTVSACLALKFNEQIALKSCCYSDAWVDFIGMPAMYITIDL